MLVEMLNCFFFDINYNPIVFFSKKKDVCTAGNKFVFFGFFQSKFFLQFPMNKIEDP